jgi:hypothetical protein
MTGGYHFFVEIDGGQWHRTESGVDPSGEATCSCGISCQDPRVLKVRGHDDSSWKWAPSSAVAPCFPEGMRASPKWRIPEYGHVDAAVAASWQMEALRAENKRLRETIADNETQHRAMRACIVYARDRRGGMFDFDEWSKMVEHALSRGDVPPHALEEAQGLEAETRRALYKIRDDRDRLQRMLDTAEKLLAELRDKLRIAKAVRDDARKASARDLEDKRAEEDKVGCLLANFDSTQRNLVAVTEQKNGAYAERDRCVAALAALAVRLGWSAWLGKHPSDQKWDTEWTTIVFINLPSGQVSWHIHDSEREWFSFLPTILERPWDGHTTEQKYKRLAGLSTGVQITHPIAVFASDGGSIDGRQSVELTAGERVTFYRDAQNPDNWRSHESEHDQYDRATGDLGRPIADTASTREMRVTAKYPPDCRRCNDRGVIETGNNDLPCDCPAGDMQLFNTTNGVDRRADQGKAMTPDEMEQVVTVKDIAARLEEIRAIATDDEMAHSAEDDLWRDVLTAIAAGSPDAALLAAKALESWEIEFSRWCA